MLWQGALMNAAAVTACLLAVLGPGLSLPAGDCGRCFYRQTPPRGPSSEALRQRCHGAPGGRAFATLHSPTCDTAVLAAFRVGHVGTARQGEEPVLLLVTENEDAQVFTPALLQGDGGEAQASAAPDDSSPLRLWDSSVAALVRSSVGPRCSSVGGDLYVVTGRGRLAPEAQDGDEGCQAGGPFWSAMCCDVASGGGGGEEEKGFGVALVREAGGEDTPVSVEQLGEMLGVTELFSEGCGGGSGWAAAAMPAAPSAAAEGVLTGDASTGDASTDSADPPEDRGAGQASAGSEVTERTASAGDQAAAAAAAAADVAPTTSDEEEGTTPPQDPDEEQSVARTSEARGGTESGRSPGDGEAAEQTAETEADEAAPTNSTLVYLISTGVYILTLPLRPVVSTITNIPGQVVYILQEDLGVLAALPGDTAYMLYFVTCGVLSWARWAVELVLDAAGGCVCGLYYCSSAMAGELLGSCYAGVAGVGTLAGDSAGIAGDVADKAWWVTRQLGGRLWEQSKGYTGTVASEMGGQTVSLGGGLGTLVWRILRGVFRVIRFTVGVIWGTMRVIAVGVMDPSAAQDDPPAVLNALVSAE